MEKINNLNMKFKETAALIFDAVIKKYWKTLVFSVLTAFAGIIFIVLNEYSVLIEIDWIGQLSLGLLMATVVSLPVDFLFKNKKSVLSTVLQVLICVVFGAIGFSLLYFPNSDDYPWMFYFGVLCALICFTVFLFVPKENSKSYYANLLKNFLFAGLLVLVGYLGCILLIFAFSNLIVEIEDIDIVMEILSVIFYSIFFINLFTYYLFEKREEPSGKAFKILFVNVLFPVYVFLLLILYLYLLKALFTWSLPNGQINWFVSFSTMFYLVFYFVLQEHEDLKIISLFYKIGAFVMLPLIAIQFVACFIRLNAYGFTGWRYSSFIYNLFAAAFVILTFIKKGHFTRFAIAGLSVLILISTVSPLNFIDVAYRSQYRIVVRILEKYEMFQNHTLYNYDEKILNQEISSEEKSLLNGAVHYIRWRSEHECPDWIDQIDLTIADDSFYEEDETIEFEGNLEKLDIDVSGYSSLRKGNSQYYDYENNAKTSSKVILTDVFDSGATIDVSDFLLGLDRTKSVYENLELKVNNQTKIIFEKIWFNYSEEEGFHRYELDYYVLSK